MAKLPDNAFTELKEGEEYKPILSPERDHKEVTLWSVGWGLLMTIVFSAAAAFLGVCLGVKWMRRLASDQGYALFAYYCWGLALFTFILNLMA